MTVLLQVGISNDIMMLQLFRLCHLPTNGRWNISGFGRLYLVALYYMGIRKKIMKKDRYVVVEWPESQLFLDDYQDEIHLVNDESGRSKFGNAAYFVEEILYQRVRSEFEKEMGIYSSVQNSLQKG